jgi:hypothetical protein
MTLSGSCEMPDAVVEQDRWAIPRNNGQPDGANISIVSLYRLQR